MLQSLIYVYTHIHTYTTYIHIYIALTLGWLFLENFVCQQIIWPLSLGLILVGNTMFRYLAWSEQTGRFNWDGCLAQQVWCKEHGQGNDYNGIPWKQRGKKYRHRRVVRSMNWMPQWSVFLSDDMRVLDYVNHMYYMQWLECAWDIKHMIMGVGSWGVGK